MRCAGAYWASTDMRSSARLRSVELLAGWLAEVGGTQLAFLVAGLIAAAATVYGWSDTGRAERAAIPPMIQVA